MELKVKWSEPITLCKSKNIKTEHIEQAAGNKNLFSPGIYIFARKYENNHEALYVGIAGSTSTISGRIRDHSGKIKIMEHLAGISKNEEGEKTKNGARVLIIGKFIKNYNLLDKYLKTLETGMIRHYSFLGHNLFNTKKTKNHNAVQSQLDKELKGFIPSEMFIEKPRNNEKRKQKKKKK